MSMEYKFVNPSDPYTFIAEDLEIAALVVFTFGVAYGAEPKDGSEGGTVPIFLFGGAVEWYKEKFGRTPDEGMKARKNALADALESMMLGDFEDRRRYTAALEAITDPEKRDQFIVEWQDGRSSLNDIGTKAHTLGRILRDREEAAHE